MAYVVFFKVRIPNLSFILKLGVVIFYINSSAHCAVACLNQNVVDSGKCDVCVIKLYTTLNLVSCRPSHIVAYCSIKPQILGLT